MSPYLAASTSIEPSGARTSRPSISKVTNFCSGLATTRPAPRSSRGEPAAMSAGRSFGHEACCRFSLEYGRHRPRVVVRRERGRLEPVQVDAVAAPRLLHVPLELGPELLDHRADRHRHRVAEHAQ